MKILYDIFVLTLVFALCDATLYSGSDVLLIKGQTHLDHVLGEANDGIMALSFFTPTCQPCSMVAPEYIKFAKGLAGIVTVAAADCSAPQNKKVCEGVDSFPSIKIYEGRLSASLYTGVRTAKELSSYTTKLLTDEHVQKISVLDEFKAYVAASPEKLKAVLFTSKTETTNMFKGLSMQLNNGLEFAEVHESSTDIVDSYSVADFPTLIVIKGDGSVEIYDGPLKAPAVFTWLLQFSIATRKAPQSEEPEPSMEEGARPGDLQVLTLKEAFELETKEDMHLLGLFSSECADKAVPLLFSKAVGEMGTIVEASLVNIPPSQADKVQRWGASASKLKMSPCSLQIVLFPFGEEKDDHLMYKGELNGKDLSSWVTSEMPDFTEKINADGMDYFLSAASPGMDNADEEKGEEVDEEDSEDYSNKKIKIKAFLYTDKQAAPGIYKALSLKYRGRLSFGFLTSGTREAAALMAKYKVNKSPTLFLIVMVLQPQGWGVQALPWTGPLKYGEIASWLDMGLGQFAPKKQPSLDDLVRVVADDRSMDENCLSRGGLCIIALVGSPSSSDDEKIKKAMASTAAKRQGQPFSFVLMNASRFGNVAASFGLRQGTLPALVALSAKRMRFASLPSSSSSWDASGVASFIDGVLGGKIRTELLERIPEIIEGGKAVEEDSQEQAPAADVDDPIVEEEFDLSDIMSEEIEDSSITGDKMKRVEEELKAEEEAAKAKKTTKKKKKSKKSKLGKTEL